MGARLWAQGVARLGREDGATAVEYALMVGLIAIVIVAAVGLLGTATQGLFQSAVDAWPR